MTLSAGTRMGPYEVLAPLGAGGMGEVYRARDSRLSREVAIKVLPADVAADASRLKRFEKEARSASALNHPNIVTIYDIGETDSISWIAMEFVEGRTLREVLAHGALAVKRLIQIATQIADGLAGAHEAGIVRDLKPENVMVTKDGLVKILDFGLAKLTQRESDGAESLLPTVTRETQAGTVLGTVGYMSPEQASGKPVDHRSDQFALGAILYEMTTGRRAFQRATTVQTLAAIVGEEPEPVGSVNPQVPAPLCWIIERCLAKEPPERYASTRDLARDLVTMRDRLSEAVLAAATLPKTRLRTLQIAALLALAALAAAAGLFAGRSLWKPPQLQFRQLKAGRVGIDRARFAPDGSIVFSARSRGEPMRIFSVRPESSEPRPLAIPPADLLSVSTTGQLAILLGARFNRGTLAVVPAAGGAPRELAEDVAWADWLPDGKALAIVRQVGMRRRIEFPTGTPVYETSDEGLFVPRVSPRGDRIAFWGDGVIQVVERSGKKRTLPARAGLMSWSPDGSELWFSFRTGDATEVHALSLDGRDQMRFSLPGDWYLHDISRQGQLLFETSPGGWEIAGMGPGENRERSLSWLNLSYAADLSDDGTILLFADRRGGGGGRGTVYKRQTDGSQAVTLGEGDALALSPDGKRALTHAPGPPPRLVLLPTGPGETKVLDPGNIESFRISLFQGSRPAGWFPDGKSIWFNAVEAGQDVRCYAQEIAGGNPVPISPRGVQGRLLTPDGKMLLGVGPDRKLSYYPLSGAPPSPVEGAVVGEEPIRWGADGRTLLLREVGRLPVVRVMKLDLSTGRREPWREFSPVENLGMGGMGAILVSADEKSWVYCYQRSFSDLFLVDGVR